MEIEDLGKAAQNVIDLHKQMKRIFTSGTWDEALKMAIMAGLQDAYNAGKRSQTGFAKGGIVDGSTDPDAEAIIPKHFKDYPGSQILPKKRTNNREKDNEPLF